MSINVPPTIAANIGQFTGRTWLLPQVLDWYERSDERVLLITGGPGTGKSMVMAWLAGYGPEPDDATAREQLAQIRAQVRGAHFCMAASGSTAPKALAQNLAEQLTRNVPGFAGALAAFLPVASDPVAILREAHQAIADHLLKNLSIAEREKVLGFCADQKLFSPPVLDRDTLAAIAGHIVEVCQEWRWM